MVFKIKEREIKKHLKIKFGYDDFRNGQKVVIENLMKKKDTLAVMPTGSGKSLCYQLPATLFEGVAIVISPLISLMKDQVDFLNSLNINSAFLNSTLSTEELINTEKNLLNGKYKMVYIAPERFKLKSFKKLFTRLNISMLVIDEAHCISHWGSDFRPSYGEIGNMINCMKNKPVIAAFTATATQDIRHDIIKSLGMKKTEIIIQGFDRPNLFFEVVRTKNKDKILLSEIRKLISKHSTQSGIVYTATRNDTEKIKIFLEENGINTAKYHAGMSPEERIVNQERFINNVSQIIVATNAFGMGIDKKDVRLIVHYSMPKDLESYYQEAGRAGRDGKDSRCVLLFSRKDIVLQRFLINNDVKDHDSYYRKNKNLQSMINYCYTSLCLRQYILDYFEDSSSKIRCDKCTNCASSDSLTDITQEAQKIISCIYRVKEHFGPKTVAKVLNGKTDPLLEKWDLDKIPTFGMMKEYEETMILHYIYSLCGNGIIEYSGKRGNRLKLNDTAWKIIKENQKVFINIFGTDKECGNCLLENLLKLRNDISAEENVKPFMILKRSTIEEIAKYKPVNKESFLKINGIGKIKYGKYGQRFMKVIKEFDKV